jgi:hypothetical protein
VTDGLRAWLERRYPNVGPPPAPVVTRHSWAEADVIQGLLLGRRVVKVDADTVELDDGRQLRFVGNEGCVCGAGGYDLTELNGVDNIITKVEFVDSPADDYDEERYGHYAIYVFADNQKINLATFVGADGAGGYGTGYAIDVIVPASWSAETPR